MRKSFKMKKWILAMTAAFLCSLLLPCFGKASVHAAPSAGPISGNYTMETAYNFGN